MSRKSFTSFAEIDQELEILALEKQLQLIKLRPGTLQKFVIMLIARKFLK